MIDAPAAFLICSLAPACLAGRMPNFTPSLDLYPDVVWPPRAAVQEQAKPKPRPAKPTKSPTPRRIIIPGYAPAMPVPGYWRQRGKGWDIGP